MGCNVMGQACRQQRDMGTWTHVVAQKRKGRKGELLHLSRNLVSLLVNRSPSWTWQTRATSLWTLVDVWWTRLTLPIYPTELPVV